MGKPWFLPSTGSQHEMFYIYSSPRDLAKIGAMVANRSRWRGKQIVPEDWIELSTSAISQLPEDHWYSASGYIWWLDEKHGTIWTDGYGGQFMIIDPERRLVVSQRTFTGNSLLSTGLWLLSASASRHHPKNIQHIYEEIAEALDHPGFDGH